MDRDVNIDTQNSVINKSKLCVLHSIRHRYGRLRL